MRNPGVVGSTPLHSVGGKKTRVVVCRCAFTRATARARAVVFLCFQMRPRISIRALIRPLVRPLVGPLCFHQMWLTSCQEASNGEIVFFSDFNDSRTAVLVGDKVLVESL